MDSSAHVASAVPVERYSATAIGLHWAIALLMICGFWLGWIMTDIPGMTPTKLKYFSWHKWIGVTVFALAVIRVIWRATHRARRSVHAALAEGRGARHAFPALYADAGDSDLGLSV